MITFAVAHFNCELAGQRLSSFRCNHERYHLPLTDHRIGVIGSKSYRGISESLQPTHLIRPE
jgi:hypothetical protein